MAITWPYGQEIRYSLEKNHRDLFFTLNLIHTKKQQRHRVICGVAILILQIQHHYDIPKTAAFYS